MSEITLRRPDDWHVHLRDGAMLAAAAPFTARQFGRAMVMPNLDPPVTTTKDAAAYRDRIVAVTGPGFTPLMACFLTDETDADDVVLGFAEGVFSAVKLYPANATTNSAAGVTELSRGYGLFERMADIGMPLLVHGEVTDGDVFDREAAFIGRVLAPLLERFPTLRVVFEHITTEDAVDFVNEAGGRLGATITAHHLVLNRSSMFEGGIRPHRYCLPVAKRERHRLALRRAAALALPPFFLGTDSAPHAVSDKESACGCAGIFSAPAALEIYAQMFDEEGALDRLEDFASLNGARFYGLPVNEESVTLMRGECTVPEDIPLDGGDRVRPFMAGRTLPWRLKPEED
jgi:dihydroorotase